MDVHILMESAWGGLFCHADGPCCSQYGQHDDVVGRYFNTGMFFEQRSGFLDKALLVTVELEKLSDRPAVAFVDIGLQRIEAIDRGRPDY